MKNSRLVIGNKNYSPWSLCPWLLLKMYDIEFEEIQIALYQDNTAEKLGPYSPSLKVPVLLHKQTTVWDSLAVCEYISEILLQNAAWPTDPKRRAAARSISSEIHSEFPVLKEEWPFNCRASFSSIPSANLFKEISRIDAIWSSCRYKYGNNGNYLFGRFSIADCLFAPIAIVFNGHNAKLSSEADTYMNFLLDNPFIQKWMTLGRRETQALKIASISTTKKFS